MIQQEDIEEVGFPSIVVTLYLLQVDELSVEWDYVENLKVTPLPDRESIADRISEHFEELKALQPGHCDECGQWAIKRIRGYWGPKPMFCVPCWRVRLLQYQRTGNWPAADFDLDEL
jgi:hypothetical protein